MYADRYTGERRFNPGGLAAAVGINAAVVGALMFAAPMIKTLVPPVDPPIDTYQVPIDPPPPPDPQPRTEAKAAPRTTVTTPLPPLPLPERSDWQVPSTPDAFPLTDLGTTTGGTGTATAVQPEARPAPVIVAPGIDPRYADAFQPAYPPSEQRAGANGKVTVRVLIGTDGRVKQVERVSATSDAFYRATETQALRRWRFRPGTRDGVAEEAWRTMTVTFVMAD